MVLFTIPWFTPVAFINRLCVALAVMEVIFSFFGKKKEFYKEVYGAETLKK